MRLLTVIVLGLLAFDVPAFAAAWDKPGWQLAFQDEFAGTQVDTAKWVRRYKWGEAQINGELQAYVDDAFQVQNDILTIVGDKRTASYAGQTFSYASGVLCSVWEQKYGYFEARLKVPAGQGMWPAFWLLGKNGSTGVNEIDIHEILGNQPNKVYMTVHWGTDYNAGHKSDGTSWVGPDFSADFHVFGLEWNPDSIIWTIDGVEHMRRTGDGVPQVEMYIILNLAIGGTWPGPPDSTTPFPGRYAIDYVRAYTRLPDAGVALDGAVATGGVAGSGGVTGNGGAVAAGGAAGRDAGLAGASGTGGRVTTGGTATGDGGPVTGGVLGTGGTMATGGVVATGGETVMGGSATNGGARAEGGSLGSGGGSSGGGVASSGGAVTGSGGTVGSGGTTATGSTARGSKSGCGCRIDDARAGADSLALPLLLLGGFRRPPRVFPARRGRHRPT